MLAQSPWVRSWPPPVKVGWVMGGGCSVRVAMVLGGVMMTMGLGMVSLCLSDLRGPRLTQAPMGPRFCWGVS